MAGGRLWIRRIALDFDLETTTTIESPRLGRESQTTRSFSSEDTETWFEPVMGFLFQGNLADNLVFLGHGTASGFNWDGMALTLIGTAALDWMFAGTTSLRLGCRGVYIESNRTENRLELRSHGPFFAVKLRF